MHAREQARQILENMVHRETRAWEQNDAATRSARSSFRTRRMAASPSSTSIPCGVTSRAATITGGDGSARSTRG